MPRMPKDPYADEFGVPSDEDLVGDTRSTRITCDLDSLDKRLHALPPLNGRAPITDDVFGPDPEYVNIGRSADAPTIPRCNSAIASGLADAPEPRPEPSHNPERAAAELWSEFGARLPSLTSDPQAVGRAVAKIVEAGEF